MNCTKIFTSSLATVAIAFAVIGCSPPAASQADPEEPKLNDLDVSEPGRRPDMRPSSLEFWATLEGRTLEQIRTVERVENELAEARQKRAELTKKHATADEGSYWSLFESEKQRIGREIGELEGKIEKLEGRLTVEGSKLQDYLSSTPAGRQSPELDFEDYRLNKEAIEMRNALENLQALGKRLAEEIRRNPKNTKKAVECYDAQLRALGYTQLMHIEFVRRCRETYPKYLDDLTKQVVQFIATQERVLERFDGSPDDAEVIARTIDKARGLQDALPQMRENIQAMEQWASHNLEQVRNKKVVIDTLRGSAELLARAKDIATSVNAAFTDLTFEDPPIVEYEFDPAELDMGPSDPEGMQ